ncbi:YhfC family intramembrane metalloprotease [Paenibacillus thermotolerans]|uniref:YhfC family intramembrane metalloprotease n=1 Tax=Paenibacillus thermotolerans TaxID=3027807 RepID=UPI002368BE38|nr:MULTISPECIES: YhfC family glutamic-type intramembrane protease [unclassified Paenibacillus]
MVSNLTIGSMFASAIFALLLFTGLIIFFKKKEGISVKPIVIGALGFIVCTQVLEKILHTIVVLNFPNYAEHPWIFGIYGGLAAGTFEELGRFALFVWLLKKYREYKDGIAFGVGWGGIEAVVIILLTTVPNIIFAMMMNEGTFESSVGANMTAEQLGVIKEAILNHGPSSYLLGMLERLFAVFLQIAFSLLVLLAVVKNKFSLVILSLLIHAIIDFPLVFFQTGHFTQLWVIEAYIGVIAVCSLVFISKSRKWFPQ